MKEKVLLLLSVKWAINKTLCLSFRNFGLWLSCLFVYDFHATLSPSFILNAELTHNILKFKLITTFVFSSLTFSLLSQKIKRVVNMFISCINIFKIIFIFEYLKFFFIFQYKLIVLIKYMFEKIIMNAPSKFKIHLYLETIFLSK